MGGECAAPQARGSEFWLIAKSGDGGATFTIRGGGRERALPVFSFEDEARLYLRLSGLGGRWTARMTTPRELAAVLMRLHAGAVALDPLPGKTGEDLLPLISLKRYDFLKMLRRRSGSPRPYRRRSKTRS